MKSLTVQQLINTSLAANRNLTLVTSSSDKAIEIVQGIRRTYVSAKQMHRRFMWTIGGITVRIQVVDAIPEVSNVWHV